MLLILVLIAILPTSNAAKITDPVLTVGENATSDFTILHKDGGYLKKEGSQGNWFFSDNGTVEKKFGTGSGSGSTGVNFLLNSGFEDAGTPLLNWTNSGGTLTQETHTNGREGNLKFARFVATVAGQYFESDAITISDDVNGGCMADFKYNQGDNAFDYKVLKSPYADPADVISSGTVSDLTEFIKVPTIVFPCAGGDLLKLRVVSTGAGTIDADEAYSGSNKGFVDGQGLSIRSAKISSAGVVTDEHGGDWISGSCVNSGTAGSNLTCTLSNPTLSPMNCAISNTSPAYNGNIVNVITTNTDLFYTGWSDATSSPKASTVVCHLSELDVPTQEAYSPEQADFFIDVNIGGAAVSAPVAASPKEIVNAGLDMVLNKGSAKIPCSTTNVSSGLTCSSGSESLGVVFTAPVAGGYKICMNVPKDNSPSSSAGFRMVETLDGSQSVIHTSTNMASILAANGNINFCGLFNFSAVGEKVIRLFLENDVAFNLRLDRTAAAYERDMNITVELVSHNVSRPIIQNMVSTGVGSGVKTESCTILNTGSVSAENDSGLCSSWIDILTLRSTGSVRIQFLTGTFSSKPVCDIVAYTNTDVAWNISSGFTYDNNEITIDTYKDGSLANHGFNITCKGAR